MVTVELSLDGVLRLLQVMGSPGHFAGPIAQIVISFGLASIVGLLQILGSLGYLAVSIAQITAASRSRLENDLVLRILQLILAPSILTVSGGILFFQGWRLDPIMQLQQLLLSILIGYLILLDLQR